MFTKRLRQRVEESPRRPFHLAFAKGGSASPKTMVDNSPKAQDVRLDLLECHVDLNLGGRAATCFANALRTTRSTLRLPRVDRPAAAGRCPNSHAEGARWMMNEFRVLGV